jgi:hypothetical protein
MPFSFPFGAADVICFSNAPDGDPDTVTSLVYPARRDFTRWPDQILPMASAGGQRVSRPPQP